MFECKPRGLKTFLRFGSKQDDIDCHSSYFNLDDPNNSDEFHIMFGSKIGFIHCIGKKRENVGIFPSGGPPPSPCLGMTCFFFLKKICFILHFRTFFWGVSHVKNSKKWKWDLGRPPPCFFKIPTFSRFFLGDVPNHLTFIARLNLNQVSAH